MSVYTPVSPEELDAWLARYAVGALVDVAPIAAGIENTNYFVTTGKSRYVLTLYERLPSEDLPFFLNLMAHLARAGVPVVLNPGAWSHYSYAVRDACAALPGPLIEVHLSQTASREPFRHHSVVSEVAHGTITGLGFDDEQIMEFTYITMMYCMHAVITRALRLEFDDRDDPIVEVPAPDDYKPANLGRQIAYGMDQAKETS